MEKGQESKFTWKDDEVKFIPPSENKKQDPKEDPKKG